MFPVVVTAGFALSAGDGVASTLPAHELENDGYTLLGKKWGNPALGTPGGVVTYSFMPTGASCGLEYTGCTVTSFSDMFATLTGWADVVTDAFAAWSSVADISFVQVADHGGDFNASGAYGDIRMGGHSMGERGRSLAHAFAPPPNGTSAAGDIHLDTEEPWAIGFGGLGFDLFQILTHEIGHSIGLGHSPSTEALMYGIYTTRFRGLQTEDILGAVAIYGAAPVSNVPLPASLPLMLGGVALMGMLRLPRRIMG
ncbi:hypothetical protein BV911_13890 [Pseudoruegeria sp. SK021]|nr:hypothetical protein BV911_13890 [Pseudoruegeria sp. SK021]